MASLREAYKLQMFENRVFRKIFKLKKGVSSLWCYIRRNLNEECRSPGDVRVMKSRRLQCVGCVARTGETNAYKILVEKPLGKLPLGKLMRGLENIKLDLWKVGCDDGR
jgi:hypothetical protein